MLPGPLRQFRGDVPLRATTIGADMIEGLGNAWTPARRCVATEPLRVARLTAARVSTPTLAVLGQSAGPGERGGARAEIPVFPGAEILIGAVNRCHRRVDDPLVAAHVDSDEAEDLGGWLEACA